MPHSIISEVCEGVAACVEACPVGCINASQKQNTRGKNYFFIDPVICIDCGVCMQVCPVNGAVIDEERPDLQII